MIKFGDSHAAVSVFGVSTQKVAKRMERVGFARNIFAFHEALNYFKLCDYVASSPDII